MLVLLSIINVILFSFFVEDISVGLETDGRGLNYVSQFTI